MIWTQKDGTKINSTDMTTSHLRRTLKMLERKLREYENYNDAAGSGPDDWRCPKFIDTSKLEKWIEVFEQELNRRPQ